MKLSKDQVQLFWRLWKKVCLANHWDAAHGVCAAAVTAKRKDLLARCGFKSLTEVDRLEGFSRVKRELLKAIDNLACAMEELDPNIERARRLRWVLEHDLAPCLALYHPEPMLFILEVAADKFQWRTRDRVERPISLADLDAAPVVREVRGQLRESASQLDQLVMTVSDRLNVMRGEAGETVHMMRTRAGVACKCSRCRRGAEPVEMSAKVVLETLENEPF